MAHHQPPLPELTHPQAAPQRTEINRHGYVDEEGASVTVDCAKLDGERQLGQGSCQPVLRINVGGQFVVAAANILDKGVTDADHPYRTALFETAHRP